jgi:Restriction endonuclease
MPDYDFHQLSPYDLEILAGDLLQAHWSVTLESFKAGRDGGVDLRYATGSNKTVVQVKHYLRTGLNGLLRDLKTEASKVHRLQPCRYVLVTSVPLSPANKDAIVATVGADVLRTADVLGASRAQAQIGARVHSLRLGRERFEQAGAAAELHSDLLCEAQASLARRLLLAGIG